MTTRRQFISYSVPTLIALSAIGKASAAPAHIEETDATANALGYKHDATKVDGKKFAGYATGHVCSNCQLYQGAASDPWGACAIMGGKQVNAKGWCSAWAKKA